MGVPPPPTNYSKSWLPKPKISPTPCRRSSSVSLSLSINVNKIKMIIIYSRGRDKINFSTASKRPPHSPIGRGDRVIEGNGRSTYRFNCWRERTRERSEENPIPFCPHAIEVCMSSAVHTHTDTQTHTHGHTHTHSDRHVEFPRISHTNATVNGRSKPTQPIKRFERRSLREEENNINGSINKNDATAMMVVPRVATAAVTTPRPTNKVILFVIIIMERASIDKTEMNPASGCVRSSKAIRTNPFLP